MTWTCDRCGREIETAEAGNVQWITVGTFPGERTARDLRLVHAGASSPLGAGRCEFNQAQEFAVDKGSVSDRALPSFLGPDGLMNLLEMLEESDLPREEVLEMIKRLQVPGYEQARVYLDEAVTERVIELNGPEGYPTQSQIQRVLEYAAKKDD